MNAEVTATGMEVQAKSDSSLLISINKKPASALVNATANGYDGTNSLVPITLNNGAYKFVEEWNGNVDPTTGSITSSVDTALTTVEGQENIHVGKSNGYYVDYVYMIADAAANAENATASLAIDVAFEGMDLAQYSDATLGALTVDFYWAKLDASANTTYTNDDPTTLAEFTSNSYVRATYADQIKAGTGDTAATKVTVTLPVNGIPQVDNQWICVIARVYFDGDLEAGRTAGADGELNTEDDVITRYVRGSKVDTSEAKITMTFKAATATAQG